MLLRFHQECGARVAREIIGTLGVLSVLDIGDRAHFLRVAVADEKSAALVRKLALRLRDYLINRGAFELHWSHDLCKSLIIERSRSFTIRTRLWLIGALRPTRSASSTILPFSASIS